MNESMAPLKSDTEDNKDLIYRSARSNPSAMKMRE
jgi:hypothetical protein